MLIFVMIWVQQLDGKMIVLQMKRVKEIMLKFVECNLIVGLDIGIS